jgi:hypothetical protein
MHPQTVPAWTTLIGEAAYTVTPAGGDRYEVWRAAERLGSFDLDLADTQPPADGYFGRQVRAVADAFIAASRDERA